MSLTGKIKDFLSGDTLSTKKQKEQKKEQLASKAFDTKKGGSTNRDTGKHSNSVTPTQKSSSTLKTTTSTGVPKASKEKGVSATKVTADNFNGTGKSASQNGYIKLKQGAGLYNDDDIGFSNLKAGSVRMSDSQKGNNNSKPKGTLDVIKMANIQSKHMDKTVQNTINAHNASVIKGEAKEKLKGDITNALEGIGINNPTIRGLADKAFNKIKETPREPDKADMAILSGLKNPKTSQQTIDKLEKYGKKSFGSESSHVLEVNPVSKSLVPRQDKAADRENALADAWESTKKSETRTKPITVKSVNGKAPKGLYPGDKVVTNAGTYTIKSVLSDGSYITDATETFKDASGKTWEKAPDTTQTKYNTYEYNDPKEKRDITYKKQGVFEHIGDTAKQLLNDDSKSKEYKQKQAETYSKVEQEFLNDKESSKYTGKNHGLLSLMGKGTESEWSPKMGLLSSATQMQKDMYNYTYAKHGKKAAKEYLESLEYTQLNPKNAENVQKMIETDVKSSPVMASIASVGANVALPQVAAVRNAIQGVKNATGMFKYKPIDANDSLNAISNYGSKVRGAVSEKIKNPALRVGYNAVMSMADMAAQTATLGGAGSNASKFVTLSMSTVSANDTVLDTLSRGGTQQQAFLNGIVNGALEFLSESPAVEGVFNVGRGIRPVKDVKSFAISTLRQMGIEAGGEGFANITQNLADQIIMGDKSNFGQTVKYYEQEGKSHKEAVKQATMDMYVKQTAEAMATGALAGGMMGGAASAFNTASAGRNINSNTAYAKDLAQTANEIGLGGKYAETAKEISKGHNVSSLEAANLKGAIQDYYQKKTYDDIARFYNYVGLEAPHRLATAFGKASSRDETGYNNQKFTDAWLKKSTDILMQIEQYKADPENTDLKTNIKEYLKNSNALLYSGVLSEDGQYAAAVRARANEVINGIPASAAGQNIVSNDSDLYAEDTENANAENNNADIDTQSADGETSNARVAAQSVGEDATPVIDITDDVVPLSESASEVAESNNATTGKVASTGKTATQNTTTAAEPTVESAAAQSAVSEIQPVNVKEPKLEPKSQPKKEPKTVDDYVVGQKKGSTVTYHKSAEVENNSPLVKKAIQAVGLNLDYDLVREEPRNRKVTFIKVDDFDGYTEPTIESEFVVTFNKKGELKEYHENEYAPGRIIPDKSEYVPLNYTGFNVAAQKAREDSWKNALDDKGEHRKYESSRISNPDYFYDMFGDIVSRGERSEDISESETANEQEQNNVDLNGYSIDESSDGSTFTVYDPDGYYEDEFKSRKEAEEYVRSLSDEDKKDKKDDEKEVKSETETEKESETESEDISDSEGINEENRQNSANTDNKTEESEDLDSEPFIEDEYELIDWEDLDEGETEPVAKKIDMDKIRSNRAIASEMKQAFDVLYDTPKSANQMGKLVKEIYDQVVEDGYYDLSAAADSFRYEIENNRYIGEDLRTPEEKEFYQAVTHSNFKVDDAVKSEITDYGDWQKANKNIILKSGKNGTQSIDNFYSYIKSEYPDVFYGNSKITGEATTEGDMLVELVAAAREIQKKMYTREGGIGTAFEGLDTEDISLIWADKLGEVLSIAKPEKKSKKAKTEGKTNESENKKKSDGKGKKSTSAEKSNRESKSGTEKEDGRTAEKGRAESSDAEEKVSEAEPNRIIRRLKTMPKGVVWKDAKVYDAGKGSYGNGKYNTYEYNKVQFVAKDNSLYAKLYGTNKENPVKQIFFEIPNYKSQSPASIETYMIENSKSTTTPYPLGSHFHDGLLDFYRNEGLGTGLVEPTLRDFNPSSKSEEPTILKARGKKQQSAPNKDNPLRGSLNDLKARQNYGKTDEAIRSIKPENRAIAENIGSIIKEIGKTFHVNIYAKRYRNMGRNTLGWFDNMHSQIHTQEKEQLGITIHELGHKLDKDFGLNGSAGVQDMLNGVPGLKQEMEQRGYNPEEMQMETIADFVWKYLSEPDTAWEMGSYARNRNFYETFELALDKKTLKDIKAIRADILAFTTKNTTERMRGQIRTREEVRAEDRLHVHDLKTPNRAMGKLIQGFDRAYGNFQENFIDSTWAASKVVKDIEKASGRKLTPKENLQLALEFAGSNASVTDTLITRGFIKPNGELTGRESFADIIKATEEKGAKAGRTSKKNAFNDFALYLIARQSIDRERMGQVTMSQDATGGDNIAAYEQLIRDMDSKYGNLFEQQSDAVYEWYDAFMRSWMVETGLLSEEKYEMMRSMYPHYVPMFRVMDTRHANGQVSKGVNPLKHNSLKGSTREIYNPIENIMIQVNNIVKAYHNNEVAATIHRLWTSEDAAVHSGIGQFVTKEEVKLQKQQVDTTEIKGRLENKVFKHIFNDVWSAEQRGEWSRMSDEEKAQLKAELANRDIIDDVIDDTITQFVPTDNGLDKDVVVALINGEKHYYRIMDEYLAQAITAVQPTEYMFKHIAKLTRVFSALTTSQNPIFAISNAIRDFQHGWVYTDAEHWYQNFTYPVEWITALGQALKNEFSSKHQSDMYKQYKSTTGFDHKYMADSDTLGEVMKSIHRSHNPLVWAAHFIDALNTAVESAPRYVAYKRKFGATGEVMTAGKAAREATVNFNRKGAKTKRLGQAVPFLGAAVAGVNQFVTLLTSKETYTTKNGRLKLARAFATQAIPAVLLAFINSGWFGDDDEKRKEYDELSEYTKNNYWIFKWGDTWVKLPRDREISALFGTLFQNIVLDNIYPDERDSTVTKEFLGYLKEQLIPSVSPVGWALVQARNNKTWYGSDLISSSNQDLLKNPETYMDITDESTSEIANFLAKQINKGPEAMREALNVLATPKGVEYILDQLTGGLGDVILPLTTPAEKWAGLGESLKAKYTFNEDKSSRYTSEAYDIKDKLTALNAADKLTDEEKEWLTAFSKTMSKSSGDDPDYKTVGDYFADIRAYRNDLSMSYSDRAAKMNKAYEHIAEMTYDLVRAYKGGGTPQGSYAEKIIPSDIDSVGFTPETYTAAFNRINKGDESAKKLALAADTELNDKQKEYLSQDLLGKQYANYAKSYKKMADAGVTPEQITKAYDLTRKYDSKKAKALTIIGAGGDNAELIAMALSGATDNTYNKNLAAYRGAVKAGVTGEMYDSTIAAADTIAKANKKAGVTKDSLRTACKQAGYNYMQTMYIVQMRFPPR
nr:MAG TPA: Large polyvalent protein associated domain 38 [Caudoviricetes sp.]